jgi:hypothetical protein
MLKVSAPCLNNDREIKDCRVSWAKNVGNDKAVRPWNRVAKNRQPRRGDIGLFATRISMSPRRGLRVTEATLSRS